MTQYEKIRDSLIALRLDIDLQEVLAGLEKNKTEEPKEGEKVGIFKRMGNSLKDSRTEKLSEKRKTIEWNIGEFHKTHTELIAKEELGEAIKEALKDDQDGLKKALLSVFISGDCGFNFAYERSGEAEVEKLLGLEEKEFGEDRETLMDLYAQMTKKGLTTLTGAELGKGGLKKLDDAILSILLKERNGFIASFALDSGAMDLDLFKEGENYGDFDVEDLGLAYALTLFLAEKRWELDGKEDKQKLLGFLVKQELSILPAINYDFLAEHRENEKARTKFIILRNFEGELLEEFTE